MGRGGLLGDWEGKLDKLIALASALAEGKMNDSLVGRARSVIASQQKREFKTLVGPDGVRWPANKNGAALFPHGTTKGTAYAVIDGLNVRFGFNARIATVFQRGQGRMHRQLVPEGQRLGVVWGPRLIGSLRQLLGQMARLKQIPAASSGSSEAA